MIIISSRNGDVGIQSGMQILKNGGSAMDAVEVAIRLVEANPEDHTVGYNGWPNIIGELELDASIMDGKTLNSGAVAGMQGYPYAISVARQMIERKLPHVLLVGAGAERFAQEIEAEHWESMLTEEVKAVWEKRLIQHASAEALKSLDETTPLQDWVRLATDPERVTSTVNFIAIDKHGDICTGVSTSGWAWKYPGRVGDSPIIGAGNYADNRYGACACTGMGEMAIRANTAHSVVFYMKMGLSVVESAQRAMEDLRDLGGNYIGGMNLIALDKNGEHVGMTSMAGRRYIYQTADMETHQDIPRTQVDIPTRWG